MTKIEELFGFAGVDKLRGLTVDSSQVQLGYCTDPYKKFLDIKQNIYL